MKHCDRILIGKVDPPHVQQIGGSQENDTNHNKEGGKISNGDKRGKYSLSDPSVLLQDPCTFIVFHLAYRH